MDINFWSKSAATLYVLEKTAIELALNANECIR